MPARRIARALRVVAPAVAAAWIAAAGGSLVAPARAGEQPTCDDGALGAGVAPGEALVPCAEPPPTTTATETAAVEEPPPELPPTETAVPDAPPPVETVTTLLQPDPAPAQTLVPTTTAPDPASPAPEPASAGRSTGGVFGSGARIAGAPLSETPKLSGGPYVFPVIGPSSFSDTWGAARATVAWHHGVDIFAPLGAPIVAVADGTLFSVGWNTIGGWRLWLRDREGNYFYYAHLAAFSATAVEGARVRAGTVVGYVGDTGDAEGTPYHLHFEIHPVSLLGLGYDGAVNPFPYVSSWPRLEDAVHDAGPAAGSTGTGPGAAAAPPPGAILLGFTDISSAGDLSAASLEQRLEEPPPLEDDAVAAALASTTEQPAASAPDEEEIPPPRDDGASIARSLDAEAARPARYAPSVWDELAECEAGGDWRANTGNGFVGGLQFLPQTWSSHGGSAFAPSPHLASRDQQITVAERVLETQGWRAWPACSALLGLRAPAGE